MPQEQQFCRFFRAFGMREGRSVRESLTVNETLCSTQGGDTSQGPEKEGHSGIARLWEPRSTRPVDRA